MMLIWDILEGLHSVKGKKKKENTAGSSEQMIQIPYASCYFKEKSHPFPSENHTEISQAKKHFQECTNRNMHSGFYL